MPTGWTTIGGTPPDLRRLLDKPHEFEAEVKRRLGGTGAALRGVYFEKLGGPVHVLYHGADPELRKANSALGTGTYKELKEPDEL